MAPVKSEEWVLTLRGSKVWRGQPCGEARKRAGDHADLRRLAPPGLARIGGQWLPLVAEERRAASGLDRARGEGAAGARAETRTWWALQGSERLEK